MKNQLGRLGEGQCLKTYFVCFLGGRKRAWIVIVNAVNGRNLAEGPRDRHPAISWSSARRGRGPDAGAGTEMGKTSDA